MKKGLVYIARQHTDVRHNDIGILLPYIPHLYLVPPTGALNTSGVYKFRDFLPISCYILQTIQDSAMVTTEGE